MKKLFFSATSLLVAILLFFASPVGLMAQKTGQATTINQDTVGEIILIPFLHQGSQNGQRALGVLEEYGANFICIESITNAIHAAFLGYEIASLDSTAQQSGPRVDSLKKTQAYANEVQSLVNVYRIFQDKVGAADTATAACMKTLMKGAKTKYGPKRLYTDGYTVYGDSSSSWLAQRINVLFDSLATDTLKRLSKAQKKVMANHIWLCYEKLNITREDNMARVLIRKAKQGYRVGFPVGYTHEEGLFERLKKSGVPFTLVTGMRPAKPSKEEILVSYAMKYSRLPRRKQRELVKWGLKNWK